MIGAFLCAALAQLPTPQLPDGAPADAGMAAPAPAGTAPTYEGLTPQRMARIQRALQLDKLDGWLFFDFRRSDEIAYRLLGLDPAGARSRRWYCLVPAQGPPRKLLHAIEPRALDGIPGSSATYTSWRTRDRELGALLRGVRRVAMDYSPRNEIPTVARVDGGTLELVRSMGPEIVSSADLVAELESTLTPEELASQARAAELLSGDLEAVAQEAARRVREDRPATERELQEFARARWAREGFDIEGWPGVAVDAHTADPHYSPPPEGGALAGRNSLLLLDFSARLVPAGIYGDLTRVYFLGESVPAEIQRIAGYVFQARDAAVQLLRQRAGFGKLPSGAEVDASARNVIANAGYGERFLHRTGHSIDHHGHGDGVNNDDFETRDTRRHLPDTCFSIEPGIYLAGRFGVRSEIDVCLPGGRVELRGGPGQSAVPALLAP
ncbi:MAG: aminopeptidase P family protein [Deltaproteobacteria bacterium]|nr:MAG: aminopeptidase P family protein [Deltaproteobacteria bacterium]